jgi:hypothetical protein
LLAIIIFVHLIIDAANPELVECERFMQQAACAPQRGDLSRRIRAHCAQLDAALAAEDFELVASLGVQLQPLHEESAQLPLSEEDYLTLPARHAALVQRVMDKCKVLAALKDYKSLDAVAAKLEALKTPETRAAVGAVATHLPGKRTVSSVLFAAICILLLPRHYDFSPQAFLHYGTRRAGIH